MAVKKNNRTYSYGLDIIRIICTVAVLVYHLNPSLIPGGFLAVCVFLVLHGYLFILSGSKQEHFSVIGYYTKRFFRLYLPMAVVVFLSLFAVTYFPDLMWLNKKPESLSVLLGYNNWWQISAGQSYFSRVTDSPFTHMWYMSLLIQAELLIPLIYRLFRLLTRKIKFIFVWILFVALTVFSITILPDLIAANAPEMRVYFGTDARIFSIFLGMALGLLTTNIKMPVFNFMKMKYIGEALFGTETVIMLVMFFIITPQHVLYKWSFLLVSLLTLLIILTVAHRNTRVYKTLSLPIIKLIASISYEVYLVHYPVMFIFTLMGKLQGAGILLYILSVIVISILLHAASTVRFKPFKWKKEILKLAVCAAMIFPVFSGAVQFVLAKDYTQDIADLEAQLNRSAELQEQLQQDFLEKRNMERQLLDDPAKMIEDVDATNLPVTGIGDSVMLGAVSSLYSTFPNGDFDAKQNRSQYAAIRLLQEKLNNGTLGNPVVIGIGTNAPVPEEAYDKMVSLCPDRQVYFLTTTNNWQFANRDTILRIGSKYDNVTVLDWETYSASHNEYFYYDGIHLTPDGAYGYSHFILDGIAEDMVIRKYNLDEDNSVMGIGDGYLLTSVDYLRESLEEPYIIAREELVWNDVFADVSNLISTDTLPSKIFINVGNVNTISRSNLTELLNMLTDKKVYIIKTPMNKGNKTNENIDAIIGDYQNITVLDWSDSKKEHPEYYAFDRKHLTVEGSKALAQYIVENISQ